MKQKGLFSLILTIFFVLSLSAAEEWKPAQEPKTEEAATQLRTDAEQRMKEAKKRGEEKQERAREEELNIERARYDLNTAKIGEAKAELETPGVDKEQIQRELAQAQLDQQAIETRIQALSKDVEGAYEWPTPAEDPAKWNDYYNNVQKEIAAAPGEELRVLKRSRLSAKRDYADYNEQRNALEQLHDLATDQQDKEVDKFAQELQDRIVEIDAFLKNPPQALPQNAVAIRLKLNEMIPSDQVIAVKKEFPSIKDNVADLRLLRGAMKRYGIDTTEPKFTQIVDDRIESLAREKEEEPVSSDVKTLDEQGYFSRAVEGVRAVAAAVVPESLKINLSEYHKGINDMFERTPRFIDATGQQLEAYAETMVRAPQMADMALNAVDQVGINLEKAERVARFIPGQKGDEILGYIGTGKWLAEKTQASESVIRTAAKLTAYTGRAAGIAGRTMRSVGEATKWVGEQIKVKEEPKTPEEARTTLSDIERAQEAIEEERYNIFSDERIQTLKDKFFKPIVDLGKKIGTWFKEMFRRNNFKERLVTAKQNYNDARVEYLKTIGFTDKEIGLNATTGEVQLTSDQIETKLQATQQDETKQKQLKQANVLFAQRTSELASVYKDFADRLESVRTNYEFLVNGWDRLALPQQEEISGLVNMIFGARDMKIAYLDALRSSLDVLTADINSEVQGTDFQNITDDVLGSIKNSLSGATVDTLSKFEEQIGAMDDQLNATKKSVESYLQAMQQPPIPG